MLLTLLAAATFLTTWPEECAVVGHLYHHAAVVRDTKITLKQAIARADSQYGKIALLHVYQRPDLSPEAWKFFSIGVCVGQLTTEPDRINNGNRIRPRKYLI